MLSFMFAIPKKIHLDTGGLGPIVGGDTFEQLGYAHVLVWNPIQQTAHHITVQEDTNVPAIDVLTKSARDATNRQSKQSSLHGYWWNNRQSAQMSHQRQKLSLVAK